MFLGHFGVALAAKAVAPRPALGTTVMAALVLAPLYLGSVFGPPPPSQQALVASALGGWLFVAWAYWIERYRVGEPRAIARA
jgi:hypothetical protein